MPIQVMPIVDVSRIDVSLSGASLDVLRWTMGTSVHYVRLQFQHGEHMAKVAYKWARSIAGPGIMLTIEDGTSPAVASYTDQYNRRWTAKRARGQITYAMVAGEVPRVLQADGTYRTL